MSVITISSCATLKWKNNYVNRKISSYQKIYSVDSFYNFTLTNAFSGKSIRLSSKKQLKENMKIIEKIFATIPDSINNVNGKIDSFYTNENKIHYIKQHNLQSGNIHFLK